jgi:hypothetical protein
MFLQGLFGILDTWNLQNTQTINQLFDSIPIHFIDYIKNINNMIIYKQIKIINNISNIIHSKLNMNNTWKKEQNKIQIQNAQEWCAKYNIPY